MIEYEKLTRPHFTITYQAHKDGTEPAYFDANHIFYFYENQSYKIGFICSGGLTVLPADRVSKIEFYPEGASYCGQCDEPLKHLKEKREK